MNKDLLLKKENNNVTLIRIVLAICIIFFHSGGYDIIGFLTKLQISTGDFVVYMFFMISGFFISRSYIRNNNYMKYISSRFLRIFPGLIVCHWFCALIIGPLATSFPIKDYFSDPGFVDFIFKNSYNLFNRNPNLPGVFTQGSRLGSDVNGSLWTIIYEIYYYIVVFFLGYLNLINKKKFVTSLWVIMIIISYFSRFNPLFMTFCCFLSGVLSYLYFEKIDFRNNYIFLLVIILCTVSCSSGRNCRLIFPITGAYFTFFLSFKKKILPKLDKIGDLSYGLYIYAFPIQQLLLSKIPNINPYYLFVLSFIPTLILSVISWNYIEKPFLIKK